MVNEGFLIYTINLQLVSEGEALLTMLVRGIAYLRRRRPSLHCGFSWLL